MKGIKAIKAMGMAASQARFLALTSQKSDIEYQAQQINQQRTILANQSATLYNNMLSLSVPTPPSKQDFTKIVYSFKDGASNNCELSNIKKIEKPVNGYNYQITYEQPETESIWKTDTFSNMTLTKNITYTPLQTESHKFEQIKTYNYEPKSLTITRAPSSNKTITKETQDNDVTYTLKDDIGDTTTLYELTYDSASQKWKIDNEIYTGTVPGSWDENKTDLTYLVDKTTNTKEHKFYTIATGDTNPIAYTGDEQEFMIGEDQVSLIASEDVDTSIMYQGCTYYFKTLDNKYYAAGNDFTSSINGSCQFYKYAETLTYKINDSDAILISQANWPNDLKKPDDYDEKLNNYNLFRVSNSDESIKDKYYWVKNDPNNTMQSSTINYVPSKLGTDNISKCEQPSNDETLPEVVKTAYEKNKDTQDVYVAKDNSGNVIGYYLLNKDKADSGKKTTLNISSVDYFSEQQSCTGKTLEKTAYANIIIQANGQFSSISYIDPDTGETKSVNLTSEERTDEDAYEEAFNTYNYEVAQYDKEMEDINAKTAELQQQDKTLELQLKQIDTRHSAIETELDTVKNVIKNNVEKSFSTFG